MADMDSVFEPLIVRGPYSVSRARVSDATLKGAEESDRLERVMHAIVSHPKANGPAWDRFKEAEFLKRSADAQRRKAITQKSIDVDVLVGKFPKTKKAWDKWVRDYEKETERLSKAARKLHE